MKVAAESEAAKYKLGGEWAERQALGFSTASPSTGITSLERVFYNGL